MFQFTLDPRGDDRDFLPLGPDELAERLLELHEIVVKLGNARWPVGTNALGIRFRAPDDCADPAEVRKRLSDLGITKPFQATCSPTVDDLLRVASECEHRLWYEKAVEFTRGPAYDTATELRRRPRALRDMLERMDEIAMAFPDLRAPIDPVMKARCTTALATLRWVLGGRQEPRPWSPSPYWDDLDEEAGKQDGADAAATPEGGQ
jgi:hypothetical protein